MGKQNITLAIAMAAIIFTIGGASSAFANPVPLVLDNEVDFCDPLPDEGDTFEELGHGATPVSGATGPFPDDERIRAVDGATGPTACATDNDTFNTQLDDPSTDNAVVTITNDAVDGNGDGIFFYPVWYVGNMVTELSNSDGSARNAASEFGLTFRIDNESCASPASEANPAPGLNNNGMRNNPLLSESMTQDCIFEPGEVWEFIIQDYDHPDGLPADAINSINVPISKTDAANKDINGNLIFASSGNIISLEKEAFCGDGYVEPANGEQCDDGNNIDDDGCDNACQLTFCGDGGLDQGEQCDDNNNTNGDGCNEVCVIEFCGDGIVNNGEECDLVPEDPEVCHVPNSTEGPECTLVIDAVGGFDVPIDKTAMLLATSAGTTSTDSMALWMLPIVAAGIGIGVFVIKRRN